MYRGYRISIRFSVMYIVFSGTVQYYTCEKKYLVCFAAVGTRLKLFFFPLTEVSSDLFLVT